MSSITVPSSTDTILWSGTKKSVSYGGKTYTVQKITAKPKSDGTLQQSPAAITVKKNGINLAASAITALKIWGDKVVEETPAGVVISAAESIYDILSSALSSTTIIKNAHIVYSGTLDTQVDFYYVQNSTISSNPYLSYTVTASELSQAILVRSLTIGTIDSKYDTKTRKAYSNKTGTDYTTQAIKAYANGSGTQTIGTSSMSIKGLQNEAIYTFSGQSFSAMGQVI
jgi:hypothetical protein